MLHYKKLHGLFYTSDWYTFTHLFHEFRKKDYTVKYVVHLVNSDGVTKFYNFRTESMVVNFVLNKCIPSLFENEVLELACIQIVGHRTPTSTFAPGNIPEFDLIDNSFNKHLYE